MTRSRIAAWVATVYALIAVGLFIAGVPVGWLSPFLVVAAVAKFLAVRWEKAERPLLGMPRLTEAENAALKGKASLAAVLDATPRLEDTR